MGQSGRCRGWTVLQLGRSRLGAHWITSRSNVAAAGGIPPDCICVGVSGESARPEVRSTRLADHQQEKGEVHALALSGIGVRRCRLLQTEAVLGTVAGTFS